jgi:Ca2+-binding EF-hand superfamily protein
VTYPHFVEICAIQLNSKDNATTDEDVETTMKLFTKGAERPITIYDLRNVAKTLKEDVGDDVLRAMISEANGGTGVGRGVDKEGFREVMTRAGIFQ